MKSEEEIREKVSFFEKTIAYYKNLYNKKKISREIFRLQTDDIVEQLYILKWVLGEIDEAETDIKYEAED